jgi:CheY-like chemotaxis protein
LTEAIQLARILVVEDEVDTRMVLGKFLSVAGHEVIPAANGWEALLVLDTTAVDLILLDVMMPGMDGVTFLQILRQAKKHQQMPVVLVTALDIADVARRTRAFGVLEILPKTQRLLDDLMKTVHRIVGHIAAPGAQPSGVSPAEN